MEAENKKEKENRNTGLLQHPPLLTTTRTPERREKKILDETKTRALRGESHSRERLGEEVSDHILRRDMENSDTPFFYTLPYEMETGMDVFCARVMLRVFRESFSTGIVDMKGN